MCKLKIFTVILGLIFGDILYFKASETSFQHYSLINSWHLNDAFYYMQTMRKPKNDMSKPKSAMVKLFLCICKTQNPLNARDTAYINGFITCPTFNFSMSLFQASSKFSRFTLVYTGLHPFPPDVHTFQHPTVGWHKMFLHGHGVPLRMHRV